MLFSEVQGQLDGAIDLPEDSEDLQSNQTASSDSQSAQDLSCRPKTTTRPKVSRCRRKPPREIEVKALWICSSVFYIYISIVRIVIII